jgi:hypothetical protein
MIWPEIEPGVAQRCLGMELAHFVAQVDLNQNHAGVLTLCSRTPDMDT